MGMTNRRIVTCQFQSTGDRDHGMWFEDFEDVPRPGSVIFHDSEFYRVIGQPLRLARRSSGVAVAVLEVEPAH